MTAKTTTVIADSVGALLRQAREERGLQLSEVALRTRIPERYLWRFEEDAHGDLADDVYTKIYLKAYGKFLGFETAALLDHHRRERARALGTARVEPAGRRHPTKTVPSSQLVVTPRILQAAVLVLGAAALLAYFGFQLMKIVTPPAITLTSPKEGFVTTDRTVSIEGKTENEVALTINGKQVSPDDAGRFKDSIDLHEGVNTIVVTGAKKHSKEMTVTRNIIVLPKDRPAALAPMAGPPDPIP